MARSYVKAHNNLVSEFSVIGDEETLIAKLKAFMEQIYKAMSIKGIDGNIIFFGPKDNERYSEKNSDKMTMTKAKKEFKLATRWVHGATIL